MFLPCSQVIPQVLNVFPKGVLNSTRFQTLMFHPKSSPSHLHNLGVLCMDSGLSVQVLFGGEICFPFSQWDGPRYLAFILFKFGGRGAKKIIFPFFPVSQCVLTIFSLNS